MDLHLKEKRVVITGGSRGIGLACAEGFLAEGCRVTIISQSQENLTSAQEYLEAKNLPGYLSTKRCDLSKDAGKADIADLVGTADILVNNAGAIPGGGLESIDSEAWHQAWELKIFGYINLTRTALRSMIAAQNGVIVNIVGIFGVNPRYDYICGSAGNAALVAFTKAVGGYSSKNRVRVLGINPGPTRTERLESLYRSRAKDQLGDESRWGELISNLPFGRPSEPSEIADLVVFVSSNRASYLSGLVIDADGGAMYAT